MTFCFTFLQVTVSLMSVEDPVSRPICRHFSPGPPRPSYMDHVMVLHV